MLLEGVFGLLIRELNTSSFEKVKFTNCENRLSDCYSIEILGVNCKSKLFGNCYLETVVKVKSKTFLKVFKPHLTSYSLKRSINNFVKVRSDSSRSQVQHQSDWSHS